jgi:hypothetical protein
VLPCSPGHQRPSCWRKREKNGLNPVLTKALTEAPTSKSKNCSADCAEIEAGIADNWILQHIAGNLYMKQVLNVNRQLKSMHAVDLYGKSLSGRTRSARVIVCTLKQSIRDQGDMGRVITYSKRGLR